MSLVLVKYTIEEIENSILEDFLSEMVKEKSNDLDAYKIYSDNDLVHKVIKDFFCIFKNMLAEKIKNEVQVTLSAAHLCRTVRNIISPEDFLTPEEADKIMLKAYFH